MMDNQRVYKMSFASVYPLYVQKAEKKVAPGTRWIPSSAG